SRGTDGRSTSARTRSSTWTTTSSRWATRFATRRPRVATVPGRAPWRGCGPTRSGGPSSGASPSRASRGRLWWRAPSRVRPRERGRARPPRVLPRDRGGLQHAAAVPPHHVVLEDVLELLDEPLALERDRVLAVDVHGRLRLLEGARERDPDVRVLRLAGSVHDAAHDRDLHLLDPGIGAPPLGHAGPDVGGDVLRHLLEE